MDIREVNFHRVVNIVDKRNFGPMQGDGNNRDFYDEESYGGPRHFQDQQECYREANYPQQDDGRYYDNTSNSNYFERYPSSQRNEVSYPQQSYAKDDLRYQLDSRNNGQPRYFRSRRGGKGPRRRAMERKANKYSSEGKGSQSASATRHRSPVMRESAQPPGSSGSTSNCSSKSSAPDQDKALPLQQSAPQKYKPSASASLTPSSSAEGSPHSSGSSKANETEKAPASAATETEEVPTASMEPQSTPEADDLKSCPRREAIESKALEIQKHYRQDCETFRTVVKMLVEKEPSLDKLLQAPLDKNLTEMKQRCLDDLRHFMKELDEVLEQPNT